MKKEVINGVLGLLLIIDFIMMFVVILRTVWFGFSEFGVRVFLSGVIAIPFILFIHYLIKPIK